MSFKWQPVLFLLQLWSVFNFLTKDRILITEEILRTEKCVRECRAELWCGFNDSHIIQGLLQYSKHVFKINLNFMDNAILVDDLHWKILTLGTKIVGLNVYTFVYYRNVTQTPDRGRLFEKWIVTTRKKGRINQS